MSGEPEPTAADSFDVNAVAIKLHTLNPFQRYQVLMCLTLGADKKPSTLMGKMCSLLPVDHRTPKTECFMFRGFFLSNLTSNVRTHLMT